MIPPSSSHNLSNPSFFLLRSPSVLSPFSSLLWSRTCGSPVAENCYQVYKPLRPLQICCTVSASLLDFHPSLSFLPTTLPKQLQCPYSYRLVTPSIPTSQSCLSLPPPLPLSLATHQGSFLHSCFPFSLPAHPPVI